MQTHATAEGNLIRANLLALVHAGKLSVREAEPMFVALSNMERVIHAAQNATALASAALTPAVPPAPTFKPEPRGNRVQRHERYSEEGKPPAAELPEVARNNAECAQMGWLRGKWVG